MGSSKLYLRSMFALVLALGACGDDSGDDDDKGEESGDSGVQNDAGRDASAPGLDASTDANTPRDSSTPADSGRDATTPGTDAATTPDTGTPDAGTPATPQELNGCKASDYTEAPGTGTLEIKFGGTLNNNYSPKCVTIAAGRTVRFSGNFQSHPLQKGVKQPENLNAGSPNNPITPTNTGTMKEFTFSTAGTYPYFCTVHAGMVGSIFVK